MRSCTPQKKRAQKSRGNGKAERACEKSRLHPCSFSVLIRKFNPERNQCRHPHPTAAPRAAASAKQCPRDNSAGKPERKRQQPQQLFAQPDLTADRTSPAHTTVARRSDGIKRRESHGKKNRQAKQCLQNTLVRFHTGASSFLLIFVRFSGYADGVLRSARNTHCAHCSTFFRVCQYAGGPQTDFCKKAPAPANADAGAPTNRFVIQS